jgi:hypothetical protein
MRELPSEYALRVIGAHFTEFRHHTIMPLYLVIGSFDGGNMQESTTDFWSSNPDFAQADNYSVERTASVAPPGSKPFADAERFPSLLVENFSADPAVVAKEQETVEVSLTSTKGEARIIAEQDFDVLAEYRRLFAALNVRIDGDMTRINEKVGTTMRRLDALEAVVPTVYMQQQDIYALSRELQHTNIKLLTLQTDLEVATRPWYVKMMDLLRGTYYTTVGGNPVTRSNANPVESATSQQQ